MSAELVPFPIPGPAPAFRREGLSFIYEPSAGGLSLGVAFRVERLKVSEDRLWGLLTVTGSLPGLPAELLAPRGHNFLASRSSLLKELATAYRTEDLGERQWRSCLEALTRHLLLATKQRATVERLGRQDLGPEQPDLVERLIQEGQGTELFGPGGACKGWLAIALALCCEYGLDFCGLAVRQCHVLYIDAEADRATFIRRVKAVARGLGIQNAELLRVVPQGTLADNVEQLSEIVAREGIGLVIHDSVGRLSSGISQHQTYEGVAKEFQDAMSLLGENVAHLSIDHVNAEGWKSGTLAGKSGGAMRKQYNNRVSWEIRTEQQTGSSEVSVGLYHQKANNTMKFSPLGFRLQFESDPYGRAVCVRFSREDVRDSAELAGRMSQKEQVLALLRRGPKWTKELALELEISQQHAAVLLRRLEATENIVCLGEGVRGAKQWGLAAPKTENTLKEPPLFSVGKTETTGNTENRSPKTVLGREQDRRWWAQEPGERDEEPDDAPF